jgi:molybdate transport system substrate-binding protein
MPRALSISALLVLGIVAAGCQRDAGASAPIRVAAASDLTQAFEELGKNFEAETGRKVSFSFGSTGLLAKQIEEGAPFDLFAAANVSYVDEAIAAGACDGATKVPYARGRIAIWSRGAASQEAPKSLAELTDARFVHVAIANPEHAPYGIAAREALVATGIWEQVRARMVYGENVRQALQLAETGNAEAAIVALALVIEKKEGSWAPIDEKLHKPIEQALVSCRRGSRFEDGRAFAAYINSAAGREIMRRYGFLLPGESPERAP